MLHVDTTVTPPEYLAYARSFPFCVNVGIADISKRHVSGAVLARNENWDGPVIVKSNLNCRGGPEVRLNRIAEASGRAPPYPGVSVVQDYSVYERPSDLPPSALDNDRLVVERFIPERDPDGYALRFWVFCGDKERCNRFVSPVPMMKGSNVVRRESVPVPDDLRARREELGFDYGKFDFVVHDGKAILLDANRTPGRPPASVKGGAGHLADGLAALIRSRLPWRTKMSARLRRSA